ncbi:MAG: hypothetical protein A3G04_01715 [Candidatus Taylorbacteria bacterium RIFCSPLOWO2_12_FULL_44_9]|nr:MAG: hypothetical protein A3G04_01715 [Candidatus Taylorbacteria bacterium RIFCSPLOWO2_12_FULL_44_9]
MAKEKKSFLDEEDDAINLLESLVNAKCKENIVVKEDGTSSVKFSMSELRDLADIKDKIILMKRRRNCFPDKFK